ncbi:MAG TPA: ABC transporter permease [archaeon]|nr:ABC transporter permease [archaeon]
MIFSKKTYTIFGIAFILIFLEALSGITNSGFFPPISEIFLRLVHLLLSGALNGHIAASLERVFYGFTLAALVAIPLGMILGQYKKVGDFVMPTVEAIRHISPIALFPMFILFFGIGVLSKVAIIFWVAWIPILLNTISGVRSVEKIYLKVAETMNADRFTIFREIIFPSSLPQIITGLRIGVGSALLALIAAEMIGASSGIGFFIINSMYTFKILDMYAGILAVAIIGFALNYLFVYIERKIVVWRS